MAKDLKKKKFPNSKLVILKYEECYAPDIFYTERWNELEDEGFIVLDTHNLTGEHLFQNKYKLEDDCHPNELAWDIITPKVVEALNL